MSTVPDPTHPPTLPDGTIAWVPGGPRGDAVTLSLRPPAPAEPGGGVPGYELLGELGRGGMGVVYKARQLSLNRTVALKMILGGAQADDTDRARFLAEAEAVAAVHDPHVVQVFEFGRHLGDPYFVMEFLDGGSLAGLLRDRGRLPAREATALVAKCARGVQAAHDLGIVHRDLKPSNILFDAAGEPRVTDFGLAKRGGQSDLTRTGAVMGTPAYMSPEQARGQTKFVGPAADVYALGAILFECLTGRPPFQAADPVALILMVSDEEAPAARRVAPDVPRDLERVCEKCLHKDPKARYPTAGALADDLARFLAGESVLARSHHLLGRVAAAIDRGGYDVQFAAWGRMLLGFAAAIGVGHVATTAVLLADPGEGSVMWVSLIHLTMFGVLLGLFWRNRPEGLRPRTTAERQLWCVLGGFVAGCMLLGLTDRLMATPGHPHEPLRMYPAFAVLSGLTFLVLGSSYWGACHLFAAGFWALAVVLPLYLELGPAGFGLMWTAALVVVGRRLRRLGAAVGPAQTTLSS